MGKKKSAALHGASKKDRAKLEARAAELAAELERRAKKVAKKRAAKKKGGKVEKAKKGKTPKPLDVEPMTITAEAEAHVAGDPTPEEIAAATAPVDEPRHPALAHLDRVGELIAIVKDPTSKKKARAAALREIRERRVEGEARQAARDAAAAESDEEIKARVQAKREARAAAGDIKAARMPDALDGESEADYQMRKLREKREAAAIEKTAEAVDAIKQAVAEVETETGRIFEAGESVAAEPDFAKPSESADMRPDFEVNGNGQYKVMRPSDGKMVGYTRVTTYIACLEDTTKLTEWKMRLLLEGVAAAEETADREGITAKIRDLAHVRDAAIAIARKVDRKGGLEIGDLGALTERAWSDFKRAMNALADEAFELGGGREKATKGTDIHALTELHDREGITAVGDLLTAGEITPADMADVEAYAEAMRKLGAKIVERERVVVNDDLKVAGRLDIVAMVKLPALHDPKTGEVIRPAEARARRRVIDVKTGRIDYGIGKLAQQLEMYAGATGYNLETHEREDLKVDRTVGLVLHLPAGTGKATVHVVDLVAGRKGNRLAGDVRTWRNEGKRAADLRVDVLAEIDRAESEAE
jgi:hypothetical protein